MSNRVVLWDHIVVYPGKRLAVWSVSQGEAYSIFAVVTGLQAFPQLRVIGVN